MIGSFWIEALTILYSMISCTERDVQSDFIESLSNQRTVITSGGNTLLGGIPVAGSVSGVINGGSSSVSGSAGTAGG